MTLRTARSSTPPVRTPAASLEGAVLDAAAQVLATVGPHGLNIRGIAADASVSPMSIYNRFGDKAGLLDALFVRGFERLTTVMRDVGGDDPLDRLGRAGRAYRSFALDDPGTYALMFDRSVAGYQPSPPALARAQAAFGALAEMIAEVQAADAIVGGGSMEVAQRLWASIHGAVSLELRGICFAVDASAHYDALLETLVLGLDPEHGVPGLN